MMSRAITAISVAADEDVSCAFLELSILVGGIGMLSPFYLIIVTSE